VSDWLPWLGHSIRILQNHDPQILQSIDYTCPSFALYKKFTMSAVCACLIASLVDDSACMVLVVFLGVHDVVLAVNGIMRSKDGLELS
jgi:hypothetical protein